MFDIVRLCETRTSRGSLTLPSAGPPDRPDFPGGSRVHATAALVSPLHAPQCPQALTPDRRRQPPLEAPRHRRPRRAARARRTRFHVSKFAPALRADRTSFREIARQVRRAGESGLLPPGTDYSQEAIRARIADRETGKRLLEEYLEPRAAAERSPSTPGAVCRLGPNRPAAAAESNFSSRL